MVIAIAIHIFPILKIMGMYGTINDFFLANSNIFKNALTEKISFSFIKLDKTSQCYWNFGLLSVQENSQLFSIM